MDFTAHSKRDFPPVRWVFCSLWRWLAFGLGTGLLRPGPGTWGTVLAWGMWLLDLQNLLDSALAILIIVSFVFVCCLGDGLGLEVGMGDHSGSNWIEGVAFLMVLAG